jgi:uncharacterized protein (TIGR02001 family)
MAAVAGPALADGMPSRGKIASAPESRGCTTSANVGLTTDYVFRGISQSGGEAAVQGGVDFTCGRFYAGVWGSSIASEFGSEVDVYGGYKFGAGPITFDVGFTYYAYPGISDANVFELKAGASGDIWKGTTLSGYVYYAPEVDLYGGGDTDILTLEGTLSHALPRFGMFSPVLSGTSGSVQADSPFWGTLDYTYWNVGLNVGFLEKWSLDIRYWDTNGDGASHPYFTGSNADDRIVGTIKYTF